MRKQDDTTEAAAEWLPIESLTPWEDNPRDNAHAVPEVAKSIKRFGFASPIIARPIDGGGLEIVAGHTRHKAALSLGLDRVPVRVMDLDPADAKLLALADNRLGELADWTGGLEDILRGLDAEGVDLDGLGWSAEDLEALTGYSVDAVDMPHLNPDESPLVQITFTLTHDQKAKVEGALDAAKRLGDFGETGNVNSNGNAIARIAAAYQAGGMDGSS